MKHHLEAPGQYAFDFLIDQHPLVRQGIDTGVVAAIQADKRWGRIEGTKAALVDMNQSVAFMVEPATLNIFKHGLAAMDLSDAKGLAGVALLLSRVNSRTNDKELFSAYRLRLRPGGTLLVLEAEHDGTNLSFRHDVLVGSGFAYVSVVHKPPFILWHGDRKKTPHHKPTNLWESPRSSAKAYRYFEAMQYSYDQVGLSIISTDEIEARIASSKYVLGDLELLWQGRMVLVGAECGCMVRHAENGDWLIERQICEGEHRGLAEAIAKFEQLTPLHELFSIKRQGIPIVREIPADIEELGMHGDGSCGGTMMRVSREMQAVLHKGRPFARFQITEYCTSCGFEPFADRAQIVDAPVGPNVPIGVSE